MKLVFSIQINVVNNNIYNIEKCLIKLFDDFVLFEVFKNNKFSKYVLICTMIIEIIIFVFFIIIDAEITNSKITFPILNLITFENKKNLIFMFNDFHFRLFILIIKKDNKIFIVIIITGCNKIINVEIN